MATASKSPFTEFPYDLVNEITEYLPRKYRPRTLLSVALLSHRLHDIVVPRLLYRDVQLRGETSIILTLRSLIEKEEQTKNLENAGSLTRTGNPTPSQCIRYLYINDSSPIRTRDHLLYALLQLLNLDGLSKLHALTLCITENAKNWAVGGDGHSLEFYMTRKEWIQLPIFNINSLESLRLKGQVHANILITVIHELAAFPPNLHILEICIRPFQQGIYGNIFAAGLLLFKVRAPELRTLVLDYAGLAISESADNFWMAHPKLERLELGTKVEATSFNWGGVFTNGSLPNIRDLKCIFDVARVLLPRLSTQIVRLSLLQTRNAQGAYLLRTIVPGGIFPSLRSLGMELDQETTAPRRSLQGQRWREEENGTVSVVDPENAARQFDANYIMSISKAAPYLEELELVGPCSDTVDSIAASLCRLPLLRRLGLSGPLLANGTPLVTSKNKSTYYDPDVFEEVARNIANGCRTLKTMTVGNELGVLALPQGLSAEIVRVSDGGTVRELKRIDAFGNIIGREDELMNF